MQRRIAKFLVLIALAGNIGPLAQGATATPTHACCIRKSGHHCHDSLSSKPEQATIRDGGCCDNNCRHAVVTLRWAHTLPAGTSCTQTVERYLDQSTAAHQDSHDPLFQSTRAPPPLPIA
jgi:hypothetical protein